MKLKTLISLIFGITLLLSLCECRTANFECKPKCYLDATKDTVATTKTYVEIHYNCYQHKTRHIITQLKK